MALIKSTNYAPDVFRSLHGILLIYKPPCITSRNLVDELKGRIADSLNSLQPRPIATRLVIEGGLNDEKRIVEAPNLADHPLVSGPRYNPWDISLSFAKSTLSYRSSGLGVILLGSANKYFREKISRARLVSTYHITGRFGYMTDTFFYDGKIIDKSTFRHIQLGKLDSVLSRIESVQSERLFDSASVPLDSQEAYELAKAWPSRPPKMARWPVIYRLKCIHLKLPVFKIEVAVVNETETFLAQLCNDIGIMLKSRAFTESIRRVKQGPFHVSQSLTDAEWDLQSIINNLTIYNARHKELHAYLGRHRLAMSIDGEQESDRCSLKV